MPAEYFYPPSAEFGGWSPTYAEWSGGTSIEAYTRPGGGRAGPPTMTTGNYTQSPLVKTVWKYHDIQADWPGPVGAVTGMTFYGYVYCAGSGGNNAYGLLMMINGASGASIGAQTFTEGWTTRGTAGPYGRPGGGSWGYDDFASSQMTTGTHFRISSYSSDAVIYRRISDIWGLLTYVPPGGGYVFLLGLTGALPFLGTLVDFTQFMKYLDWRSVYHPRRTTWPDKTEIKKAWEEVKNHKFTTYFLPREEESCQASVQTISHNSLLVPALAGQGSLALA